MFRTIDFLVFFIYVYVDDDDNEEKEKKSGGHRACIYKVTHLIKLLMNQKIRKEHFAWCTSVNQ
jgi:hypothetical protein